MQSRQDVRVGIDTSGSPLLIAVQKGDKRVVLRRKGIKQERLLFPALNTALKKAGASLQEVTHISLVRGPGRFTGIRISLTFASMMKYLNHVQVFGATVFEIIRLQVEKSTGFKRFKKQHPTGVLAVVLHAFREEYFLQIYDGPNSTPSWLSREELFSRLSAYAKPVFIAGADKDSNDLTTLLGESYPLASARDGRVRPETLFLLSQSSTYQTDALEPLYLKPARFELMAPK